MDLGVICLGAITGSLLFKEKISKINKLGILLSILAIILMQAEILFSLFAIILLM